MRRCKLCGRSIESHEAMWKDRNGLTACDECCHERTDTWVTQLKKSSDETSN